jgi:FHS family L-fucose permease-like MFS transporter
MAIVGGALIPMLMGWIADVASMRIGMVVPLVCFVAVGIYAAVWKTLAGKEIHMDDGASSTAASH